MRYALSAVVLLCLVLSVSGAAFGQAGFVYFVPDLGELPYYDALAVLAFQGLVNRDGARLYVNTRTLHPWCHEDAKQFGNEWDAVWLDVYAGRGYTHESVTSIDALFGRSEFRSSVAGLVIYDPDELSSSAWVAMTIAGVEDRLPVTPELLATVPDLAAWWPDQTDLRGAFADKVSAYEWLIDNYLSLCSQELTHIVGHDLPWGDPGDIIPLDYAVTKRAFIFDLSLDADTYPEEQALADVVVSHPTAPGALMGWNGEVDFSGYASEHGHHALNGVGMSNLSFHRHMPPVSAEPLQQTVRFTPEELYLDPDTYYVAVVYINGNAPERLTRFFSGDWLDAARGSVPINWTVPAPMIDELPVLFEYFYSNATANDYFVGSTDIRLGLLPNPDDWATLLADAHAAGDITAAACFDYDLSPSIWDPFLATTQLQAVACISSDQLLFRGDHVPFLPTVFKERWSRNAHATAIADDMLATMTAGPPTAFAVVYERAAGVPGVALQVMNRLAPHGFVFLRLDEMGALASQIDHFHDVGVKYWAHDEVEACFSAGVVQGYSETHYRPTVSVSRDQMAVYIARALVAPSGEAGLADYVPADPRNFPDAPDTGYGDDGTEPFWAYKHIEYCVENGVVQGFGDGTYHPEYEVSRDQMAVYIARALVAPTGDVALADYVPADPRNFPDVPPTGYGDDGTEPYWAYTHVEYCVENGVVQGYDDGNYHPDDVVTRDQMAVYIARAFELMG